MVYGSRMPLNQVATVTVPEARMISVQVWDRSNVTAVDKAIREANLGLNPIMDGQILRLPVPSLTADRRQELVKLAHKYAEHCKVSIRNVRREAMDLLKKLEALVPQMESYYQHDEGNSDAHVKSLMVGNSVTIPIDNGRLVLGKWQAVYLCEFDGPRERRMHVKFIDDGTELD